MKTKTFLALILLFAALSNGFSQTKFDDAVALNFKNITTAVAGYFDNNNNLVVARQIAKEGSYYLEIGSYDENGAYTIKKILDLSNDPNDVKVKFTPDGTKAGILELSPDRIVLTYVDIVYGQIIQDFNLEGISNFFLTPDGRSIVVVAGANTVLFDIAEGEPVMQYSGEIALDISGDGNTLFCRNGSNIDYLDTKTGKKVRSFPLKDFKSIDFDDRGEIMICLTSQGVKLFKLTQENVITLKEIDGVSAMPVASGLFDYFIVDNGAIRGVYNLGGVQMYKAKIDPYNQQRNNFVFSKDDGRMALLSDKGIYVYDFDMIKYYNKIAQKYPDLFITKTQFENDQDQENRASRVKFQKQMMVSNVAEEMKVSEGLIKQAQKNSLGLVDVKVTGLGYYNPNTEMYDVTINVPVDYLNTVSVTAKVKVPKFQAEIFSRNYQLFRAFALRQLNRDQTGVDVFGITIVNDLNSTNYRCIMHRTLPPVKLSYDEEFAAGQKYFEMRNWYDALLNISDFPEDFKKNSVIDYMFTQAINNFFDEKWSYVQTLNPVKDSTAILVYLSDFPKSFKNAEDVNRLRQTVVNNIMETRLDRMNQYLTDKEFLDGVEYSKIITTAYFDPYSAKDVEYEYYKSRYIPARNNLLFAAGKRAFEGNNWTLALDMLNQITKDYPQYSDVEKMISDAKYQSNK